jgi:sigma-B regulation protein RsbU (phosphoserine phosphatase)
MRQPSLSSLRGASAAVLVIDDSRALRQILKGLLLPLEIFGSYLEARDGAEALEILASRRVDIVLCDLDMPVLDGFGFLKAFRADPGNVTVPVMMLSTGDQGWKRAQAFALGASDYVVKPCGAEDLRARVENCIRRKVFEDRLVAANRDLQRRTRELRVAHAPCASARDVQGHPHVTSPPQPGR